MQTTTANDSLYQFTPDMEEISGFGGTYETGCRTMLVAACQWLAANPEADLKDEAIRDAFELATVEPIKDEGPTGAMVAAAKGHARWINEHGWDAYVTKMTNPGGQIAILERKLADEQESARKLMKLIEKLRTDNQKRGVIIASKVLGWKQYGTHSDTSEQRAYGPSKKVVRTKILPGDLLSRLVDDEIDRMTVE